MTCYTFSNSELNSELENVDMTPYMHVFKKFIFTSEHFSNRIRGAHLADLTQVWMRKYVCVCVCVSNGERDVMQGERDYGQHCSNLIYF